MEIPKKEAPYAAPWRKALELPTLVLVTILVLVVFGLLLKYVLPVALGFVLALVLNPLVMLVLRLLGKRCPRALAVLLVMVLLFALVGSLLVWCGSLAVTELVQLGKGFPAFVDKLDSVVNEALAWAQQTITFLTPDTVDKIAEWVDSSLADLLVFFSNTAANMVKGLTKIPQIFFACIITILATFFFLVDRHKLYQHMRRHIPEKWLSFMVNMYKTFIHALVGWIRAQLIIMLCLGTVILIGLLILHVNYAFLIALAIALLDALPLFGSAAVLLPWSVYCLFTGAVGRGIGLAVIYLCAVVTRQLIEPRIVGQQIGIHPLLTLTAMYAGFVVAGVLGLILGPMLMLLLKYVISAYLNGRTYKEAVYGSTDEGVQKAQLLRQSAVEEQLRGKTIKE